MTSSPTTADRPKPARKRAKFTTATVVSFSLTLFAASVAILSGAVPLRALTTVERIDIGTMLFVAPVLALILAVMAEATRIAMSQQPLPEPRRQQVVRNWTPGRREG